LARVNRLAVSLQRLVFFAEPQDQRPERDRGSRRRLIYGLVAVLLLGAGWWLFVPPIVHRPSAPIWCPATTYEHPAGRFEAREVAGKGFSEGYEIAARHGCVVREREGNMTAELRTNRISVDVSRGEIARIVGIE
jgi:hypothetical protein